MFDHGIVWGIATIVGPVLLFGALIYGVIMYGRRGPAAKQHTDEATRELYREAAQHERRAEGMRDVSSPPIAPDVSPLKKSSGRAGAGYPD